MKEQIQEILQQEDVKYVIGYEAGTYGWRVSPSFAKTPEDVEKLIFSPFCINNLTIYTVLEKRSPLPEGKKEAGKKIGVMVKGCDSRALTLLMQENAIAREDVIILGLPCRGTIDPQKMRERFGDVLSRMSIEEKDGMYRIEYDGKSEEIPKAELLAETCAGCRYPNPLDYDLLLGDPVELPGEEDYAAVKTLEAKTQEERWEFWKPQFERCVRCYACRNVCPVCHCEECMADTLQPGWIRRSVNVSENTAYHTMRAFHMAGRCISCGMCEKACPMDIPLTTLYKKVEKDVLELFDYEAGIDPEKQPLLSVFDPNDTDEGIL